MGLFSKHKKDDAAAKDSKAASDKNNEAGKGSNEAPKLDTSPKADVPPMGSLSSPPVPKASNALDDIKSEVSTTEPQERPKEEPEQNNSQNDVPFNGNQTQSQGPQTEDDSLFDFSGSDLFGESDSQEMGGFDSQKAAKSPQLPAPSFDDSGFGAEPGFEDGTVDTHMGKSRSLSFEGNHDSFRKKENENFFMTTQQFKAMMELVESVKSRVKDSSDRHLKLLDIKSEEDVEYENLRRDFQYVEDKLYELDSIIFNK